MQSSLTSTPNVSRSTTAAPTAAEVLASFRGAPHSFVDVGHSRLAYRRFGAGPDLVFVHGWPLHSATYRAVVPLLAGSFTCHLLDLPCAGQSEGDADAPVDTLSHAKTVKRATEVLGLGRFALVGHDSGGFIARLAAADNPRVAGLVLANTEIPRYRSVVFSAFIAGVKAGAAGLILRALRSRAVQRSYFALGEAFFDKSRLDGDFQELFIERLSSSPEYVRRLVRVVEAFDLEVMDRLAETHAKIRCPSLLIWGREDPFFPVAVAKGMLTQLAGGARLVEVPEAKLLVHEERPEAFAEHATPFLLDALR